MRRQALFGVIGFLLVFEPFSWGQDAEKFESERSSDAGGKLSGVQLEKGVASRSLGAGSLLEKTLGGAGGVSSESEEYDPECSPLNEDMGGGGGPEEESPPPCVGEDASYCADSDVWISNGAAVKVEGNQQTAWTKGAVTVTDLDDQKRPLKSNTLKSDGTYASESFDYFPKGGLSTYAREDSQGSYTQRNNLDGTPNSYAMQKDGKIVSRGVYAYDPQTKGSNLTVKQGDGTSWVRDSDAKGTVVAERFYDKGGSLTQTIKEGDGVSTREFFEGGKLKSTWTEHKDKSGGIAWGEEKSPDGKKLSSYTMSPGPNGGKIRKTTRAGGGTSTETLDSEGNVRSKEEEGVKTFYHQYPNGDTKITTQKPDGSFDVQIVGKDGLKGARAIGSDGKEISFTKAEPGAGGGKVLNTKFAAGGSSVQYQDKDDRTTKMVFHDAQGKESTTEYSYQPDCGPRKSLGQAAEAAGFRTPDVQFESKGQPCGGYTSVSMSADKEQTRDLVDKDGALVSREVTKEGRKVLDETKEGEGYSQKVYDEKGVLSGDYKLDKDQNILSGFAYEGGKQVSETKVIGFDKDTKNYVRETAASDSGQITRDEIKDDKIASRTVLSKDGKKTADMIFKGGKLREETDYDENLKPAAKTEYRYTKDGSSKQSRDVKTGKVTVDNWDGEGKLTSSEQASPQGKLLYRMVPKEQGYLQTVYKDDGTRAEHALDEKFNSVESDYYGSDGRLSMKIMPKPEGGSEQTVFYEDAAVAKVVYELDKDGKETSHEAFDKKGGKVDMGKLRAGAALARREPAKVYFPEPRPAGGEPSTYAPPAEPMEFAAAENAPQAKKIPGVHKTEVPPPPPSERLKPAEVKAFTAAQMAEGAGPRAETPEALVGMLFQAYEEGEIALIAYLLAPAAENLRLLESMEKDVRRNFRGIGIKMSQEPPRYLNRERTSAAVLVHWKLESKINITGESFEAEGHTDIKAVRKGGWRMESFVSQSGADPWGYSDPKGVFLVKSGMSVNGKKLKAEDEGKLVINNGFLSQGMARRSP